MGGICGIGKDALSDVSRAMFHDRERLTRDGAAATTQSRAVVAFTTEDNWSPSLKSEARVLR